MGRPAKATTVVLVPGVNLKCDPRTRIWYFNSSLNRQTIRKSTGEKDETAARIKGMEWYFLLKEGQGRAGILNCISFDMLAESYLKTVIGDAKWRYHSETIDRHLLPYFETHGDIKQINEGTISDYLVHRRTKGKQEPVPQTLNRENTVLRQMMAYAALQKWIADKIAIPYINQSLTVRRRRHFTSQEYSLLVSTARRRILEAIADRNQRHVVQHRRLLLDAIIIMANSGLRVDEMHQLTWRGVMWEQGDIQLERAGKRKSSRKLILNAGAVLALKRIARRRRDWLARRQQSVELDPNEPVMSLPTGIAVQSFKTAFRALLDACGFEYRDATERHSMTSLRHTYATRLLTRKHRARPTMAALAKQMGTSPRMIEQHYGHDNVEDYRDDLRGRRL